MNDATTQQSNRRRDIRLAGGGHVDAALLDAQGQAVVLLEDAKVLNVSAGGLALISKSSSDAGDIIEVRVGEDHETRVTVRTLECSSYLAGRNRIRCELASGRMPGRLVNGW